MMRKNWWRTWAAIVALAGTAIVGGCADDDEGDVATLGKSAEEDAGKSEQRLGAEAFYECLVDAGLPAELQPVDDSDTGDAMVGWAYDHIVMERYPDGMTGVSGDTTDADQNAIDAFFNEDATTYGLVVDGVDHTAAFEKCHTSSGYTQPEYQSDPAEELRMKQQIVDATNPWIACARENGLPDLVDLTASADQEEWPTAELPSDMTVEELRALLEACPAFDEEQARTQMQPDFDGANWKPDPSLSIALPPGFDTNEWDANDPAIKLWEELNTVLYEKQSEFYSSLEGAAGIGDPPEVVVGPEVAVG
jgi:hypothetical protein